MVHSWSEKVEQHLETKLLEKCPDPSISAKMHPWTKSSRLKGNKTLEMSLVGRFAARGSGFISTKDCSLHELGIFPKDNRLGGKTSNEFACRMLMKAADWLATGINESNVVNFCMDSAFVSEENVSCKQL